MDMKSHAECCTPRRGVSVFVTLRQPRTSIDQTQSAQNKQCGGDPFHHLCKQSRGMLVIKITSNLLEFIISFKNNV